MSQNIVNEITFLLHSFLMGIIITFVYDGFKILRRLIQHNLFLISLEDMIFWIACAIGVFCMLYKENNGVLRWFAVFGAAIGMIVYKKSISSLIVNTMSMVFKRIAGIIYHILRILFKPFRLVGRKVCHMFKFSIGKSKKAYKYLKNKLTGRLKLLKITLCKR